MIKVDGVCIGFTISEIIDSDNCIEMYKKANRDYKCIYSFMSIHMNMMLKEMGYLTINYMADAGVKGIRHSKEKEAPQVMIRKYKVKISFSHEV